MIFIENTPRSYAWGSRDALPDMLGVAPTGEPQAELWLGAHPGSPAHVAKAVGQRHGASAKPTLIDLIESDPERYGVDGGHLPFLLKVLAIGAPLSLQVHPDRDQAAAGFAAEEAAGVPRTARERNYGDPNHKPELLVALGEMTALSGFRPLDEARRDLVLLARAADRLGDAHGSAALERLADGLGGPAARPEGQAGTTGKDVRREFLERVFSCDPEVVAALAAVTPSEDCGIDPERIAALRELVRAYPGDPGVLVSLLLHLVRLAPGEALFLGARQMHAYLSGVGVEVMAASDNVLRAGLTRKHIDVAELCRVVDTGELDDPRFASRRLAHGLVEWVPPVPDFRLMRATLCEPDTGEARGAVDGALGATVDSGSSEVVEIPADAPIVLIVTSGRIRVERAAGDPNGRQEAGADSGGAEAPGFAEVASARRGQSLYVSAGEPIVLTGHGEAFLATVGS
ncbi:mannose-6-phosphate isomerase, class I [Leucobacter zeae]|nr:mannose-6-phosphate isomerase, class I [Leucobacter zeae]